MGSYFFPDLTNHLVLYHSDRYVAFAVSENHPVDGVEQIADIVVWDGEFDAPVSYGIIKNGMYTGVLAYKDSETEVPTALSVEEFVKKTIDSQEAYFRACGFIDDDYGS